jgi:hypothetical protein
MTHAERLPDGRYNIVLRGVERFRLLEEDHSLSYRRAIVDPVADGTLTSDDRAIVRHQRAKLEALLEGRPEADRKIPGSMGDEDLINALAQYLDLEALEKQALLEQKNLRARAESLVELLEMKVFSARHPHVTNVAH